jgi:transcription antitermination factor NusG
MPILPPEPFSFPANLFSMQETATARPEGEWFVIHTKSRAEKALARWLQAEAIWFFLPLYKKQAGQNGRDHTSYPPLFPGYLFVWGNADSKAYAFESRQVAQCLPVHNQDELTSDLADVFRLMSGDRPLMPVQKMPPGTEVEVIDGPFAGMIGKILGEGSRNRLFVEVKMINQGVSVELDGAAVRPMTENGNAVRARLALIRG